MFGTTDVPVAPRQRTTPSPARIDRIDLLPDRPDLARCCGSSCSLAFSGMTRSGFLADRFEFTFDSEPKSTELLEQCIRVCRCVDDLKACQTAERPPGSYSRRPPSATTSWNRPRNRTCLDPQYSPSTDGQPKPGTCHTNGCMARGARLQGTPRRRSWDPGPSQPGHASSAPAVLAEQAPVRAVHLGGVLAGRVAMTLSCAYPGRPGAAKRRGCGANIRLWGPHRGGPGAAMGSRCGPGWTTRPAGSR